MFRYKVLRWAAGALLCVIAAAATAQHYPSRPLRFIVPAPPGGTADFLVRVVGPRLSTALGQQVVIDNRSGAGGVLATDITAKAAPDGLTLLLVYTPHALNAHLYKKLPYDPLRDFAPITLVTTSPLVLVVNLALPVRTVKELVALAKTRSLNYGSAGNGSGGHVSGEMLKMMAKIDVTHIPYKGAGPTWRPANCITNSPRRLRPPHCLRATGCARLPSPARSA